MHHRRRTAAALATVAALAVTLTACGGDDDQDAKPAPEYKVVHQDKTGNQRTVTVEVESTKDTRAVFDAVAKTLNDDAGYFVEINCASGGTASVDNRLGNGKKAVGRIGAAGTGLDDGATEYTANKGRTCPE
ncbi:hypothetical protein [Streptomyces sp. NRRL F-5630]|uniref:hypothetical protein n=1 Tax=Streptomyces sp. NRRL F-5630 TaxID=1463864 RepID=UPI003EB8B849